MAEMIITELRRGGSGVSPTFTSFRWTSATHSSMQNPLALKLKVNTMRRVPAGASEPVEQVLGISWEPFTVEGEWNDKWAGAGFAQQMRRLFPQMVGRTPLVRFQIDQESLVGLITDLATTYYTHDRVGYSFTFSPHTNEQIPTFRHGINTVPPQPINQRIDTAKIALEDLISSSDLVANEPTSSTDVADARAQLAEVSSAVDKAAAVALGGVSQDGERTLLGLASAFRRVRGAAMSTLLTMARKRSDLSVAFDDAISILKFEEWARQTRRDAIASVGTSRLAELDMRAKASRKPRAIHVAKQGESLERISLRYYGTADNWRAIYDANHLSSILLDGGEELIIPERAS